MSAPSVLRVAVCVVASAALGCHPQAAPAHPASPWGAPALFREIPADTPYVFATLEPLSEALRTRIYRSFADQARASLDRMEQLAAQAGPLRRAVQVVVELLRGTDPMKWSETLGLGPSPIVALYGLGAYPVFRAQVADVTRLRVVFAKAAAAAGTAVTAKALRGVAYWTIEVSTISFVMAVLDRDAMVALAPTAEVAALLPRLLELEHPEPSLADVTAIPELLGRDNFNRAIFGELDLARIATAAARIPGSPIASADCQRDLARLASYVPRIAMGYRHLDLTGYALGLVIETSPVIAAALARVRAQVPAVPREGVPLFELSAGVDLDALLDATRSAVHELRDHPLGCPPLAAMSSGLDSLAEALETPLPAELRGLRGGDVVVDDLSTAPPSGRGALLVVGSQVAQALSQLLQKLPGLGGIAIPTDGSAVALPLGMFGFTGIDSAHVAAREGIAALAFGEHSAERATAALTAAPDPHAPLASLVWDFARTAARFPMLWTGDTLELVRNMGRVDLSLEVRDAGLDLELDAGWP